MAEQNPFAKEILQDFVKKHGSLRKLVSIENEEVQQENNYDKFEKLIPSAKCVVNESEEECDEHECMICLENMKDPITLPCGHNACSKCTKGLVNQDEIQCAKCRKNHKLE